jgi:protein TonB
MASFRSEPYVTRPELIRWSACAAIVVALHAFVVLALAARPDEEELAAGAPVVTIELAPAAMAPPAPPRDLAAGPLLETDSQDRVAEETPPERKEPEKERVEETPAPNPEVAAAIPEPREKPVEEKAAPEPAQAAPVPTAPQAAPEAAPRAAAPAAGTAARPTSAAITSWQRQLVMQLERHKRYPPGVRGKAGVARLEFTLDRGGRVLASRIVHSSGSEALDAAALALIKSAEPLPTPPAGLPDHLLSVIVPIRYH